MLKMLLAFGADAQFTITIYYLNLSWDFDIVWFFPAIVLKVNV